MLGTRYIASDKDVHFQGALAGSGVVSTGESISMPDDWVTAGIYKCVISELTAQTEEDIDLALIFWSNGNFNSTDQDAAKIVSVVQLSATNNERLGGAGQYYVPNPLIQNIEYVDEDHSGKIHVSLLCKDAAGKSASGSGGEVSIRMGCTPSFS